MIRFGTDGIRGRYGDEPCTERVALRVGAAAVRLAGGQPVVIGRDTRPSGPALQAAVAAGVLGAGGVPLLAGVVPTSAVATAVAARIGGAGVMLTASHNAAPDNGFKLFAPGGHKLSDAQTAQVEAWLQEPAEPGVGDAVDIGDQVLNTYLSALLAAAGDLSALAGRTLVVDLAHGAASPLAPRLAGLGGATWRFIGAGDGVINDGVGSQHPAALQAAVVAAQADAGLAVDGDADRCVLVDQTGALVPGDTLAWWLCSARDVGGMAVTVMSTSALEAALPAVRVVRTPVGDRHLAMAMASQGLALGCEESGHVLFDDGLVAGDGLLTGLRALAAAFARPSPLSVTLGGFSPWPRHLSALTVAERRPLDGEPRLSSLVARAEDLLGPGGRIFLRYSGTEPVLRVLVEGADAASVATTAAQVRALAQQVLG